MLIIFTAIMGYVGYRGITDALLDHYSNGAFKTAHRASRFIDADSIDRMFEEGPETEEYKTMWNNVQTLCDDAAMAEHYRRDAAEYICEKYNWDTIVEKTLNLYFNSAEALS